jgi:hypothetical protein
MARRSFTFAQVKIANINNQQVAKYALKNIIVTSQIPILSMNRPFKISSKNMLSKVQSNQNAASFNNRYITTSIQSKRNL